MPECRVKKPVTSKHSTTVTAGTLVRMPVAVESDRALLKALGARLTDPLTDSASIPLATSLPRATVEAASVLARSRASRGLKPLPSLAPMHFS